MTDDAPEPRRDAASGSSDPEGDALEREIAADRAERATQRRRLWLFVPPLVALGIAAASVGLASPRSVVGVRLYAGPVPAAGTAFHARAILVRGTPSDTEVERVTKLALRLSGAGVQGSAETTDDDGVAEITVLPPLADRIVVEGQLGAGWRPIATIALVDLPSIATAPAPAPDPTATRTHGSDSGELKIDVAAEKGVLSPPAAGAAWVRVRSRPSADGAAIAVPIENATISCVGEAGLESDPASTITDASGLARVALTPTAPPVVLEITATVRDAATSITRIGKWRGVLGGVLGVPMPLGDGRYESATPALTFEATSSRPRAYVDLWRAGVRVDGRALAFDASGHARLPLAPGISGLYELEVSASPEPPSVDDLGHAASFPIVFGTDALDAWAAMSTSTRFTDRITPAGATLGGYGPAVAATLARAPLSLPRRALVRDSLPAALRAERARGVRVRRAGTFAVLGGGILEVALLGVLGVLSQGRDAQAEIDALLADEGATVARRSPRPSIALVALAAFGAIVVVFSALGLMAWGLGQ